MNDYINILHYYYAIYFINFIFW